MTDELATMVGEWIVRQRWFAGKGRALAVDEVETLAWLEGPAVRVQVALVHVVSSAGTDLYQVPLSHRAHPPDHLEHAHVGRLEDALVYDAVHDRDAVDLLAGAMTGGRVDPPLRGHPVAPRKLEPGQPSVVLSGEQSNTNVVVGNDLLLKVFRRVSPGRNPDIEVLEALTTAGSGEIVPLVGWLEATAPGGRGPLDLAMLSDFLRTATDGWDLALTSVRDLFAERDLHPDEVGGDFASESERLGATTARMHAELARNLPRASWGRDELMAVSIRMRSRLNAAVDAVPELAEHAPGLVAAYDALTEVAAPLPVQRVHGDLHLGQALRTMDGWRIIDFEGEPATPLAQRIAPDSPVRDVAGMLRSFEYAAQSQWADLLGDHQLAQRALEWAGRNRAAFLDGYADESGSDPAEQRVLLRAYEIDKAVYEAVYEARNRPTWLSIPLRAVSRLASAQTVGGRTGGAP